MKKIFSIAVIMLLLVIATGCTQTVKPLETPKNDVGAYTRDNWEAKGDLIAGDDLIVADDATISGDLAVTGAISGDLKTASIAGANIYATTTLTAANSGTTYFLSASGTSIILPAVTTAGANFRFVVGGTLHTGNVVIDSAEGDNIDGTLIVAGAVVDCRGEDQVNIVIDGEQKGDYVEIYSNGTQWYIGDSGVLTAGKMTCTDPS